MKKFTIIFLIMLMFAAAACKKNTLKDSVHELHLKNGMRWLLVERGYAPVFAGVIHVKTGGVDEQAGKTGLAHFLEHMAFKGTSSIGTTDFAKEQPILDMLDQLEIERQKDPKNEELEAKFKGLQDEEKKYEVPNEAWDILAINGASNINAYTTKDETEYYSEMPTTKMELWFYIMSDAISDPVFRDFYTERDVVIEEYRRSVENRPAGLLFKALMNTAYKDSPYHWITLGSKEDLTKLTRRDLIDFYAKNYTPNCMVGAIVGDIDIAKTKKMIEKYFGGLRGEDKPCERTIRLDPPQVKERSKIISYPAQPLYMMSVRKPTVPNFDDYIFDMFTYVLCETESSRLEKTIVKEKQLAKTISCFNSYPGSRLDNLFVFYAEPYNSASVPKLKTAIMEELKKIYTTSPVTKEELEIAKNRMKAEFLMGIDSNSSLAELLANTENLTGSWRYVTEHPNNLEKITLDDMKAAAEKYFQPKNFTIVELKK